MRAFVKTLSILLVGQLVSALEEPAGIGYSYMKFDKEKNLLPENRDTGNFDFDNFYQLSVDGPTRVYFSKLVKSQEWDLEANIERMKPSGNGFSKCRFAIKSDEKATLYYKLRGQKNQMEILEVFRAYPEKKENQLDIYAVNMIDCNVLRAEALKGYDYPAKKIYVINRYSDVDRIEYFTFNDEKSSESCMNKYTYSVERNSFSGPMKFTLLDDKRDYRINMLLPIEGEDSYIASISKQDNYQDLKLSASGSIIKADKSESIRKTSYLRYSVANGYYGLCFKEEIEKKQQLRCIQYDKDLRKKLDKTFEINYEMPMFAVRNRGEGSLYFLSLKCAKKDENSCNQAEMLLDIIGTDEQLAKQAKTFKEDYCAISTRQRFGFFGDLDQNNCLYYSCSYKSKPIDKFENSVRVRCL